MKIAVFVLLIALPLSCNQDRGEKNVQAVDNDLKDLTALVHSELKASVKDYNSIKSEIGENRQEIRKLQQRIEELEDQIRNQ